MNTSTAPKKKSLFPNMNREMFFIIMSLAWPTMLEQVMQTAVSYIDTAMVGALGTQATAAVGSTTTINWLLGSTTAAMGVGFLAFIAKACGAQDRESAKKAVSQAVLATLVVGVAFTILALSLSSYVPVWMQVDESIQKLAAQYFFIIYVPMLPRTASTIFGTALRAAGDTKSPMKIGILMNVINIILNFVLIYPTRTVTLFSTSFTVYGAGMGVIGAAVASAIAFTVGGIMITVVLFKHPLISPRGTSLRPDMEILGPCLRVAIPNMLQRFGTSLGYVAFAAMINSLGEISTAAHTIANTVESAFYIPGYGMQTAAATLAGNAYGANDKKKMDDLGAMFIPIVTILMIFSGACLFAFAPELMQIFSKSDDVVALGTSVLRMVAVSEPFFAFSIIVEGFMQGVGRTKAPFVYNIIGMWGVRIVGTFVLTQLLGMGLVAAWGCMIAHNMFLFVLYVRCHVKKLWNPLVTA